MSWEFCSSEGSQFLLPKALLEFLPQFPWRPAPVLSRTGPRAFRAVLFFGLVKSIGKRKARWCQWVLTRRWALWFCIPQLVSFLHAECLRSPGGRLDGRAEPPRTPCQAAPEPSTATVPHGVTPSATHCVTHSATPCHTVPHTVPQCHRCHTVSHHGTHSATGVTPCHTECHTRFLVFPLKSVRKASLSSMEAGSHSVCSARGCDLLGWHSFLPITERNDNVVLLIANNSLDYKFYVLYS